MIHRSVRLASASVVVALLLTLVAAPAEADAAITVRPHHGPPGTEVRVRGTGFATAVNPRCRAAIVSFTDSAGVTTTLGRRFIADDGSFKLREDIPLSAALGPGTVTATQGVKYDTRLQRCIGYYSASVPFKVTPT